MTETQAGAAAPVVKLSSLKNDVKREEEGEWKDVPEWPGVTFFVRSLEYPAYKIARDMVAQKLARKSGGKAIDPVLRDREFAKLYAEHILLGWKGLDTEYSQSLAREMAQDKAYREFFKNVEWCSAQVAGIEAEFVETAAKN